MKSIFLTTAILGAASFLVAAPAFAQAEGNMDVTLTVQDECTMSAGDLVFGSKGLLDTDVDFSSDLTVQCSIGAPYAIALSAGNGGGGVTTRTMTNTVTPTDKVNYELFRESTRETNWGLTIGTDTVDSGVDGATGDAEVVPVYGRVPSGQVVPAGDYTDTVTATIWYGPALD